MPGHWISYLPLVSEKKLGTYILDFCGTTISLSHMFLFIINNWLLFHPDNLLSTPCIRKKINLCWCRPWVSFRHFTTGEPLIVSGCQKIGFNMRYGFYVYLRIWNGESCCVGAILSSWWQTFIVVNFTVKPLSACRGI